MKYKREYDNIAVLFEKTVQYRRIFTYAQIAQLVEQRTENPRVAGSIPALGIFLHGKCLSVENKYLYKKDIVGKVSAQRILRLIIRKVRIGKHVFIGRNSGNRSGNSEVY